MSDADIRKLDYFEKAILFHNVYIDYKYEDLPYSLKAFYSLDSGLLTVQSIAKNGNIQDPFALLNIIERICPEKPRNFQQVYARAAFFADMCDTSIIKILQSRFFEPMDFIPNMTDEKIQEVIKTKGVGTYIPLTPADYTPSDIQPPPPGQGGGGGGDGDYAEEEKIYFYYDGTSCTCNKKYCDLFSKLPKLPAAELIYTNDERYNNIVSIAHRYDETNQVISYFFFHIYDSHAEMIQVDFNGATIEVNVNPIVLGPNQ